MDSDTTNKNTRLVTRTSKQVRALITRAADHCGQNLSQFIVSSALSEANDVIRRMENLHQSMGRADRVFAALDNPPKANRKLIEAAKAYRKTVLVLRD